MTLATQRVAGGVIFKVKAVPGASRERIVGLLGDALKVAVVAPPEQGRANTSILALLAAALGVPARRLEIVSGHGARDKRVFARDLDPEQLRAHLAP